MKQCAANLNQKIYFVVKVLESSSWPWFFDSHSKVCGFCTSVISHSFIHSKEGENVAS